jgi:hypothetical protein
MHDPGRSLRFDQEAERRWNVEQLGSVLAAGRQCLGEGDSVVEDAVDDVQPDRCGPLEVGEEVGVCEPASPGRLRIRIEVSWSPPCAVGAAGRGRFGCPDLQVVLDGMAQGYDGGADPG